MPKKFYTCFNHVPILKGSIFIIVVWHMHKKSIILEVFFNPKEIWTKPSPIGYKCSPDGHLGGSKELPLSILSINSSEF